jgi:hypothetical protein
MLRLAGSTKPTKSFFLAANVENFILEHLRSIRGDIASLALKVDTLTSRVASLEEHVAGLRRDLTLIHGQIAGIR